MEPEIEKIAQWLNKNLGISHRFLSERVIRRILHGRMQHLDMADAALYLKHFVANNGERNSFIDEIVIPETWFFREEEAFKVMVNEAQQRLRTPSQRLNVLCLPCATGEEAYTILLALHEAGIDRSRYNIDAYDISDKSVVVAKHGVYSANSFRRNRSEEVRDRYFDHNQGIYFIKPQFKGHIRFQVGNLFNVISAAGGMRYDFIFMRNLLIYFEADEKARALSGMARLLRDDGILFVGHAETGPYINEHFERVDWPRAFAFKKRPGVAVANVS